VIDLRDLSPDERRLILDGLAFLAEMDRHLGRAVRIAGPGTATDPHQVGELEAMHRCKLRRFRKNT
jgi:hypothetical protein